MTISSHDRSEIADVARQVAVSAGAAERDRTAVQQGLREHAGCFGADAAGRALLARYAPAARRVAGNDAQIATQLHAVANRLAVMGGTYADVEDAAVHASGTVNRGPEVSV
ncbi:hypothetical protein GC722_02265 [Auraticoccus sp. F435]|uniref:ESX-1 secretion-associated protein n=1 Tax=Auraticoccus cholistanensis TaxID=2656650 RepID=A0A6A9UQB1_9ACTN|nr:hypothetical protein [Auraticoccus cholistanensis]MVA74861.1 hypothetical protein [Auraticoccus cholistanensis]